MMLLKIMGKILLLPVVALLMIAQWVGIFLNSISGTIMGILSFIFVLTAAASLIFRLATWQECLAMMAIAFAFFLIPHAGCWLIERVVLLRCLIGDYIRS